MTGFTFSKLFCKATFVVLLILASGCSSMKIDKLAKENPTFDFKSFFYGHNKASGWFSDRFGNVRRHFCGDFFGSYDGDIFVLDEKLVYLDGMVEVRQWRVEISDDGDFKAESESLVGGATGRLKGNALQLAYRMKVEVADKKTWLLDMDDWMFYQPGGSLHNITNVSKWGLRIGTVSTQYTRIADEAVPSSEQSNVSACQ